jgi:antitoxin VapB
MTASTAYAPPLTIRNLPLDMYEWLKEQANAQHRSLNKHVAAVLAEWREKSTQRSVANSTTSKAERFAQLEAISKRFAALPTTDPRTPDEILGYDEHGLPN